MRLPARLPRMKGDVFMKITLLPKTIWGRLSSILTILFIVVFLLKIIIAIPVVSFVIAGTGLLGMIFGLVAVIRYKDTAFWVLLSFASGGFILLWIATELIAPH